MTTLLVLLCQSTVLLALGLLALRLAQKRGPAVQTLVGRATLSGVALLLLLLPLSGRIAPVWRVPAEPTPARPSPALPKREGAEVKTGAGTLRDAPSALPALFAPPASAVPVSAVPSSASALFPVSVPRAAGTSGGMTTQGAASSAPTLSATIPTPRPPASGGPLRSNLLRSKEVGLLLLPTGLLLLWLALCHSHLVRLRRTAQLVTDGPAAALLAELAPTPPALLTHPSVHSPFLAGTRRPAIFLPTDFAAEFAPDALRAVFLHEMAHRDRRDNLWALASRLLTAMLWFQPLLWLLARKLEQISEDACDAAVLAARCPPRVYAACLLSLAERPPLARSQRTLTAGVAPFRSSVGRRISRILTLGVPAMPAVTLRLRLSIAALTVAAALSGAFLVSSAPAQTQPKPAPFVPTPQELRHEAERKQDLQNLKSIGSAIIQYTQDHNERMPDAAHWMDQIASYRRDPSVFYDPFQPGQKRYAYAFNRNCSGKSLWKFAAPASTVAIFDSTLGTRNASDTGQSLRITSPASSRLHVVGSSYGFVDGHAKWFRPDVHPSFALDGGQPTASITLADRTLAQFLAGLTPVQGPGVVVTLRDSKKRLPYSAGMPAGMPPPNIIHDSDINQVVNELKAAGAEAICVNNQRLVATSAVRCRGAEVYVNNTPEEPPFVVNAIGDPKSLAGALTVPGGVGTMLKDYDKAMFTVQQAATLTLPAYTGVETPRYARPVGAGAQVFPSLPMRSFVVNFQVPQKGVHAVQVYVTDAAGRHLASAKAYGPGTKVNLPVQAVGRSVSFQVYDNGRLTKTQQIASGSAAPAPITKPAATADAARMHTIVGYGLISWTLGKVRQCRAVTNSPASRAGVPTEWNSVILAVNGQKVPSSDARFTAVCRSSPALHLLLASINGKKPYPVTISAKAPFSVLTDAAAAEDQKKYLQSAQAASAGAKATLTQTNRQMMEEVHALLPQATPATLAKALNLERQIGWSMDRMNFAKQCVEWGRRKHNPKSKLWAASLEANVHTYLNPETAEEARIFPKTADSHRQLAQIHILAKQIGNMQITLTEKRTEAMVTASVMHQRGSDVTI